MSSISIINAHMIMTEKEILHALRTGTDIHRAYKCLYKEFFFRNRNIAWKMGVSRPDADTMLVEVISDTIINLRANPEKEIQHLGAYLSSALRNRMRNFWRSQKRNGYADLGDTSHTDAIELEAGDDDEQLELRKRLEACLAKLPPSQRKPLRLFYYERRKHKEIAQQLNITPGSSKVMVSRGVHNLQKCLSN